MNIVTVGMYMPSNKSKPLELGTKFNRLTILKFSHSDKRWRRFYLCHCECGAEKTIMGSALVSGNTKSCGCLRREVGKNKRISENHSEVTAIVLGYKRHAKRRNIKWKLSRESVMNIIEKNCFYCGATPSNIKKTKNSLGDGLVYSGIDRVDNGEDYTETNVVPCCKTCNQAKGDMSLVEFQKWAIAFSKKAMASQWGSLSESTNIRDKDDAP